MSERIARWAVTLVAVTGAATMQANADTVYINGTCGNDAWSGTNSVCSAPNGPKLTIQAGIDVSVNGDTVIVADGTYTGVGNKNLDYGGRPITLRSENGPEACIIDCEDDGRGFYFSHGETAAALLEGFTIRNGNAWFGNGGGAILCESSSPTILNCVLADNRSPRWGGGLSSFAGEPTVTNCTFSGNSAGVEGGTQSEGGGMYSGDGSPTVTDCTFRGNSAAFGGGVANRRASPTVIHCTFVNNTASLSGGGMSNRESDSTVTDCTFDGNIAIGEFSSAGGGMFNLRSSPTVTRCTFADNTAGSDGGGMYNNRGTPTLENCTFSGNSANDGGGITNGWGGNPTVTNCKFNGNSARNGGGMFTGGGTESSPIVTNCTFSGNDARLGGGMYNGDPSSSTVINCTFSGNLATNRGGGMHNPSNGSIPVVTNCIFWNDSPTEIDGVGMTVNFCDVQGGWPGPGNIALAPQFVNGAEGDFRLNPNSPCIDAADNTAVPAGILTDLDGNPRFVDDAATPDTGVPGGAGGTDIVDMGAYEFPCDPCDMNCDGSIDAFDIEPFLGILFGGDPCGTCTGDVNGDGVIDAFDIEPFLECLFP